VSHGRSGLGVDAIRSGECGGGGEDTAYHAPAHSAVGPIVKAGCEVRDALSRPI